MVVCLPGLPSDSFVIRRFRGKEIGSGGSEERGESERASGLPSIIAVLRYCLEGRWRSTLSLMVGGPRLHGKRLAFMATALKYRPPDLIGTFTGHTRMTLTLWPKIHR